MKINNYENKYFESPCSAIALAQLQIKIYTLFKHIYIRYSKLFNTATHLALLHRYHARCQGRNLMLIERLEGPVDHHFTHNQLISCVYFARSSPLHCTSSNVNNKI
jgi:hypothetical protein